MKRVDELGEGHEAVEKTPGSAACGVGMWSAAAAWAEHLEGDGAAAVVAGLEAFVLVLCRSWLEFTMYLSLAPFLGPPRQARAGCSISVMLSWVDQF